MLATCFNNDSSIEVRNIQDGSLIRLIEPLHHFVAANIVAFDQDSRRLVSGHRDRTIKVWDLPASINSSFPAEKMEVRLILEGQKVRDT